MYEPSSNSCMRPQYSAIKTVFSSTSGGAELMSAEYRTAAGESPENSRSTGPRATLHIASARAAIPVQAAFRRGLAATCTRPKPSMHSPMTGSTTGCTATTAQQKNAKKPRCRRLRFRTKSTAKRSAIGRIRNLAAYLSSGMRAASCTPMLWIAGSMKTTWNRA